MVNIFAGTSLRHSTIFFVSRWGHPVMIARAWARSFAVSDEVMIPNESDVPLRLIAWRNSPRYFMYNRLKYNFLRLVFFFTHRELHSLSISLLPLLRWEYKCRCALIAPVLLPATVTRFGSPPNVSIFCWTHFKAATWSFIPILPGNVSSAALRKPVIVYAQAERN